jgi:hypothetical protein
MEDLVKEKTRIAQEKEKAIEAKKQEYYKLQQEH